ncbi:MAG: ribbon-helix-helix protein, CopG family [Mogibacterium sp.]|nr:ribbon-helix-helix protein, CopG family [Mogibacterium sp.]
MISLRLNQDDERIIREYARFNNLSVSEFLRQAALERIEAEYDLAVIREYEERKASGNVKYYSHEEVWGDV